MVNTTLYLMSYQIDFLINKIDSLKLGWFYTASGTKIDLTLPEEDKIT